MDIEKIKKIANRPGMIPLIHNYCDKWCERCPLASRCSVFAMREEEPEFSAPRDTDNPESLSPVIEILQAAHELLLEKAEQEGWDIDAPLTEEEEARNRERERKIEESQLVKDSDKYREMVRQWFDSTDELLEEKEQELQTKARLELPDSDPEAEAEDFNDILEILGWYYTVIPVKIHRAVSYEPFDFLDDDEDDDFPNDGDGSAKVALISIDRSIDAWRRLQKHFPEKEDEILDFLIRLDALRKSVEKEFPNARSFKRPGFDEQ